MHREYNLFRVSDINFIIEKVCIGMSIAESLLFLILIYYLSTFVMKLVEWGMKVSVDSLSMFFRLQEKHGPLKNDWKLIGDQHQLLYLGGCIN